MKTLMHTCCAPCSVSCIRQLRAEGIEPVSLLVSTPTSTPIRSTRPAATRSMTYAPAIGMELIVQEDYGLREFVRV